MKIYVIAAIADHAEDVLGLIPDFLNERDHRKAAEQFNENYAHGGGWQPFGMDKWRVGRHEQLLYPGDPPLRPLAVIRFREERVFIYEHSIVRIVQPDGSHEIARMD